MMRILLLFILIITTLSVGANAQISGDFQIAERLIQQQEYERALPILESIHEEQPQIFIYFERLIECYVELKRYETARTKIDSNINRNLNIPLSTILLGKIHHIEGNTDRAFQLWNTVVNNYSNQLQVYVNTAEAMIDRKEYEEAIEVYQKGRAQFNNDRLFMMDIPNTYMKAGLYDEAIAEWLAIIKTSPQQTSFIQRMLLRYNDPFLNDITILELEDTLAELPVNDPAYSTFYELQIWLLLENNLYRRAFAAAREYESRTSNSNFSLFNVGRKLAENKEFELSSDAFDYYVETTNGEIKWRSVEEKADVYKEWAKHLQDYNIGSADRIRELYTESYRLLDAVTQETSNYSRIEQVFVKKAELDLDHLFDLNRAKQAIEMITRLPGMRDTPEANYLQGRIHIAERSFTQARIALTRANKQAEVGELAEKSRYFLALTDFFGGDYEFAEIQLKTLGRQNTSYYANDAIQLRLWIQSGTAADSTGEALQPFSNAYFNLFTGNQTLASEEFLALINSDNAALKEEALILLSRIDDLSATRYLSVILSYMNENSNLSREERILWEKASVQFKIYSDSPPGNAPTAVSLDELTSSLEELILSYPQGFYAPFARERLSELPSVNS